MVKLILIAFVTLTANASMAQSALDQLVADSWSTDLISSNIRNTITIRFDKKGTVYGENLCHFSEKGLGKDLLAQVTGKVELSESSIVFLQDVVNTVRDNSNGAFCTAFIGKGFSQYRFLGPDTVLMMGEIYKKVSPTLLIADNPIQGHVWRFLTSNSGIKLVVDFDFQNTASLTVNVTCTYRGETLNASISSDYKITSSEITYPKTELNKVTSPSGFYCGAMINAGTWTYQLNSDGTVSVEGDPLNPNGMTWTKVK